MYRRLIWLFIRLLAHSSTYRSGVQNVDDVPNLAFLGRKRLQIYDSSQGVLP